MKYILLIFVCLLLSASFAMAEVYVNGSVPVPDIDNTAEEYQNRLDKLIENSKNADYLYEFAYLALEMNELEKAEDYFNLSLKRNNFTVPTYKPSIYYWLAKIYEKRGDNFKAHEYYVKHGDLYFIHLIMAKMYISKEMYDLAEKEYWDVLELDLFEQCNYEAYPLLIDMYLDLEEFKNAKKCVKKYLKTLKSFEKIGSCDIYETGFKEEIKEAEALLDEIKKKK